MPKGSTSATSNPTPGTAPAAAPAQAQAQSTDISKGNNLDQALKAATADKAETKAANAALPVPTVQQSVKVDAGSAISSLIETFRPALELAADTAEGLAFAQIPMGSLIEGFVGPHLARQYLDIALTQAENLAASTGNKTFANPSTIVAMALQSFVAGESWLKTIGLSDKLNVWLQAEVTKLGGKLGAKV